jgi:hypothetical protein
MGWRRMRAAVRRRLDIMVNLLEVALERRRTYVSPRRSLSKREAVEERWLDANTHGQLEHRVAHVSVLRTELNWRKEICEVYRQNSD